MSEKIPDDLLRLWQQRDAVEAADIPEIADTQSLPMLDTLELTPKMRRIESPTKEQQSPVDMLQAIPRRRTQGAVLPSTTFYPKTVITPKANLSDWKPEHEKDTVPHKER